MKATTLKLATVLGVAGALALSVPSAEARNGRNAAIGLGVVGGLALGAAAAAASQPYYGDRYYGDRYYRGGYAYEPAYGAYNSYNYYRRAFLLWRTARPLPPARDQQEPADSGRNYNPNQ
ncbi:MAG: hypothetical protein R3D69_07745 [Xanthobacteraceae bacterium]